ncbi:proteasome assembly chaperone 3 isoform 2-T2 [Morphnus guianensis]
MAPPRAGARPRVMAALRGEEGGGRPAPSPRAAARRREGKGAASAAAGRARAESGGAAGPGAAMEASPIVTSRQREEVVHGVPTEVVCTAFSNSVLVVVTQYGKMGTIVYVDPNTIASRSRLCQKPGGIRVSGSWEQTCSARHGFKGQDHGRHTSSTGSDPKLPSVVKLCHLDSRK